MSLVSLTQFADALSRKGQVLAIQTGSTIQIQGISFDEMKDKDIDYEFSKVWEQAVSV